ncbi:hypothetical protein WJX73_003816 [Symbiochloris irregularis]|uniref:Uncharacterized protein n=1 Tax=Symbiochloris irregularis TaxID=706552 RepID=A0AAW1NWW5_9CHLO
MRANAVESNAVRQSDLLKELVARVKGRQKQGWVMAKSVWTKATGNIESCSNDNTLAESRPTYQHPSRGCPIAAPAAAPRATRADHRYKLATSQQMTST